MKEKQVRKSNFEKFTGVYCSGFYIPDYSVITMLSLLFDEFYILNNLEYVIEFSKRYKFVCPDEDKIERLKESEIHLDPMEKGNDIDPLKDLNEKQLLTLKCYMLNAQNFLLQNHELIGNVMKTNLVPDGQVLDAQLIKKGKKGELNLYNVSLNPLQVSFHGLEQFDDLINNGAIPTVGKYHVNCFNQKSEVSTRELATLLAMKSLELIIPKTISVEPQLILEARYRLKDLLPPFWSAMLKLSVELQKLINEKVDESQLLFEGRQIVEKLVQPALIDLKSKIRLEQKNWFYRIVGPVLRNVSLLAGNSNLMTRNLVLSGVSLGTNCALDIADHMRSIDMIGKEAGLTYLLKLDEVVNDI